MRTATPDTNLLILVIQPQRNFRPYVSILRSLSPVTQLVLWRLWFRRIALIMLLASSLVLGFFPEAESSIKLAGFVSQFQISPDGRRVAYRADQDTDNVFELYSVPVAGGTPTKLNGTLVSGGDVSEFQISPDGSRVVYTADQDTDNVFELYSVPITGGTPTKLSGTLVSGRSIRLFQISPDSTRVVYTTGQDTLEVYELFSVPIAGGISTQLNDPLLNGIVYPDFSSFQVSPHSTTVVYQIVYIDQSWQVYDHYSVPIEGGVSTKLNDSPIKVQQPDFFQSRIRDFQISPDSNWVVYQTDPFAPNSGRFYSVPITGGAPPTLLYAPVYPSVVSGFRISPDSSWVVYLSGDDFAELYSVSIEGGSSMKLNDALMGDRSAFQVTPDSTQVVYEAEGDLYTVAIGGGTPNNLDGPLVSDGFLPVFQISPDSTRVVYRSWQDPFVFELYSVPIAGDTPTKLNGTLVSGGGVSEFQISPDGNRVVYRADQDTDNVFELYSVPIDGSTVPGKLNGPLVSGGNVGNFQISPNSDRVIYQADEDVDNVFELYSTLLISSLELINALIVDAEDLVASGVLRSGQGNSLISKLEDAIQHLNKGNTNGAIQKMSDFVDQVNAFIKTRKLTSAQGQPLIDAANDIISNLGS